MCRRTSAATRLDFLSVHGDVAADRGFRRVHDAAGPAVGPGQPRGSLRHQAGDRRVVDRGHDDARGRDGDVTLAIRRDRDY